MRMIHSLNRHLKDIPMDATLDDTVSLALVNRLKARIARRESRFKTRVVGEHTEMQNDSPLLPAA